MSCVVLGDDGLSDLSLCFFARYNIRIERESICCVDVMMIASQTSQTPLFHRSECSHMQLINLGDKTLCHIGNSAFIPYDFIFLTLAFMMIDECNFSFHFFSF